MYLLSFSICFSLFQFISIIFPVKPIYVNITNSSITLVADRKYEIYCETSGSRPDAIITWFKGKKSLKRTRDYNKNNQTTSILNFAPAIEDNGKVLSCHAENPNVAGLFVEDSWNMSVYCKLFYSLLLLLLKSF